MAVEKAFAINAEPSKIWDQLIKEIGLAEDGVYEIEESIINEYLSLRVRFQDGIEAHIAYRLIPRDDHTEVVATMHPEGLRYSIFQMITFGRANINYEMGLVVGLSNLKAAVEGTENSLLEDAPAD